MAEIKDTYIPNIWGEGNQKEIHCDNGDIYRIRNTYVPNIWGEGYQQEIVKTGSSYKNDIPVNVKPVTSTKKFLSVLGLIAIFIGMPLMIYVIIPNIFG